MTTPEPVDKPNYTPLTTPDQLQRIRTAIYAMVNSLGAALPMTPEVRRALADLVESDHEAEE